MNTVLIRVLFAFMLFCPINLKAQDEFDKKMRSDSLCSLLKQSKTIEEKRTILVQLSRLYWQQPEEVMYIKQILELPKQGDYVAVEYQALVSLCRHYYNELNLDSLVYWRDQLNVFSVSRGESPDELYAASNLVSKLYLDQKHFELAMDDAIQLQNESRKKENVYGQVTSSELLGAIYQAMNRDSDAVVIFREGLTLLDKTKMSSGFQMVYFTEYIISALRSNMLDEAETIIRRYEKYYAKQVEGAKAIGEQPIVAWHVWLINSFYAELYTRRGLLHKARPYMEKAAIHVVQSEDEEMKYFYYRTQILYFSALKEYDQALIAVENALKVEESPELLKIKVDLLRDKGQTKEAISIYEHLLGLNVQMNKDAFNRQIRQIRILNDLNDQEKQTNELEYQTEQWRIKQRLLMGVAFISALLLLFLYILNMYYQRTRRLKNDLLCEKKSLIESEKKLRIAKEEAEKSNQMKTAFIANISHEIRTPLNGIVGFSELLAEDTLSDEEKELFAETINVNSELLLNLVNDVLDLSRLESRSVVFKYETVDIIAFGRSLVDELQSRVISEVKIKFSSSYDSFFLQTDIYQVQRLLMNLLLNAIKFTKEGHIELSMEMDEEKQAFIFIVADTGCGIPLDKQEFIFEYFEKLDEFVQGNGLGLPICKMIADKFEGHIFIDPDYRIGARFVFVHPLSHSVDNTVNEV